MEKPQPPKLLSFAEYKQKITKQRRVEGLSKKNITDLVQLIQDGQIADAEIQNLTQLSNNEIFLLQHLLNEIEEGKFLKENLENLQAHMNHIEKYVETLHQEIDELIAELREK